MIRHVFLSMFSCFLVGTAAAQVKVDGEWIALSDVAPVVGDSGRILPGPAPPPGETLALDPGFVIAVAERSGIILAIPTDSPIWVTRTSAPTAPTPPRARAAPIPTEPQYLESARISGVPAQILVLTRNVARGDIIDDADLAWVPSASVRGGARNQPESVDDVIGMEAKRALRIDAPIQVSDVVAPDVIRKGETVQLVYNSGGVRLTAGGIAQQNAARGDPVRVLNNYSKRTIEAVAVAAGEARVSIR